MEADSESENILDIGAGPLGNQATLGGHLVNVLKGGFGLRVEEDL